MVSYQKMIVTFIGAVVCVFVSAHSSDVHEGERRIPPSKLPLLLPILAAFPHWNQRVLTQSTTEQVNDTDGKTSLRRTQPRFTINSRKFQDRKLELDPDLYDENFLIDTQIDIEDKVIPEKKVVVESSSDLIHSMYYINPKLLSVRLPNHQAENIQSEKFNRSVLDIVEPISATYNSTDEGYEQIGSNETEWNETFESKSSVIEQPQDEILDYEDEDKDAIKIEQSKPILAENSFNARWPHDNAYTSTGQKTVATKPVQMFPDEVKSTNQSVAWKMPVFENHVSHLFDTQLENVKYAINETTLETSNRRNPTYSMATLHYPSRIKGNDSIANEKSKGQSEFPISPVHSDGRLNIRTLATASVIFVMAVSALFAGTAPFWHGHFFQFPIHPPIPPFPYEIPLPFGRRQFSSFYPTTPLIPPVQEQSNSRISYDSFPYNSGLRKKRSTQA